MGKQSHEVDRALFFGNHNEESLEEVVENFHAFFSKTTMTELIEALVEGICLLHMMCNDHGSTSHAQK